MRSLDLPDEPDDPRRVERASDGGQDAPTPKRRDLPDPDERDRAYEATRAYFSVERGERAEQRREEPGKPNYRAEAPKFLDTWADHTRRWPARPQAPADRSTDSPESGEAISRMDKAQKGISANTQRIGQHNDHGGWLEGFKHRLKGEDRLREKIAAKLEVEPSKTPSEALRQVADAIRYTYCFQPENYSRGYYDIKERLASCGYEMYYSKNWWTNAEYKGINTRWVTQEGQRFEVQFHTPDSFHAKHHVTHAAYERIRDLTTSRAELRELHEFQQQVWALVEAPEGATDIPDYEKEGF